MSSKVLVVEDDPLFGESLVDMLEDEGYEVVLTPNGEAALERTYSEKFDLYLLDINLPLLDGISLLQELRGIQDNTPAIFLTSHTQKEKLKEGFGSGADDYLTKPVDNDELLLRIEALLRRSGKKSKVCCKSLCVESAHKTIYYNDEPLELSKKEYELLALLVRNSNKVVSKEMILEELYSVDEGGSEGAVRVYINRLKQLLSDVEFENIRGIGYKLVC